MECHKRPIKSPSAALNVILQILRKGIMLHKGGFYKCPHCEKYHITISKFDTERCK